MNNHPTRKELILTARGLGNISKEHLNECSWCRLYLELYSKFPVAGELPFINAPMSWTERAIIIGEKSAKGFKLESLIARLTFDSWGRPLPEGVRGAGVTDERRVSFDVAGKTFDIRAEHRQDLWEFTAKITDKSGIPTGWILKAGKVQITADEDGFYQWSSIHPPKKFKLFSHDGEIETPELSWKKSRQ